MREQPQDDLEHARSSRWPPPTLGGETRLCERLVQALALLPLSKDAFIGPSRLRNLAEIYVKVGEREAEIDQLEILVGLLYGIRVPELRADPFWALLRGTPRFERLHQRKKREGMT